MSNRATESIVVTSAGIIRDLEQFPTASGALDYTSLAFEHVLASLARLEARFDALERRQAIAQPPPRPDPKPPYLDWQRERDVQYQRTLMTTATSDENWRRERPDTGRQTAIFTSATATSPRDRLGFGGGSPSLGPLHAAPPGASPWDRSGETVASHQQLEFVGPSARNAIHLPRMEQQPWDRFDAGVEGFRGRRHTAWDNPAHRLDDQPGRLATEWDRYGTDSEGFRERRPTAWDNPTHRFADQPRYDHYRVEKPRYEKMRAPRFDGSEAANLRAIRIHVDENQKIGAVGIEDQRQQKQSDGFDLASPESASSEGGIRNSLSSPDDDSGEENGLLDELPPPAVISPPCSPYISGEEETLLDDDEEVDSIEEVKKVVASLEAARITSHDVVENCLSENCGAYLCALVGNKVAPSFPIHWKEIAFICGDLLVRDPTRLKPRSTSLDTDARLIPPRNDTSCLSILGSVDKLFVLGWNFADHIGYPLLIDDGGDEGRRSAVRCAFDPGGDVSQQFLAFNSRRCFVVSTLRTRWISTVGELIRDISYY